MRIQTIRFEDDLIHVVFDTGERIEVPLDFFPDLAKASPRRRDGWTLIGRGIGVHWETLDVDISIENFLAAHSRARLVEYA